MMLLAVVMLLWLVGPSGSAHFSYSTLFTSRGKKIKNSTWLIVLLVSSVFVGSGTFAHATTLTRDVSFSGYYGDTLKGELLDVRVGLPWPFPSGDAALAYARLNDGSASLNYTGSLSSSYTPFMPSVGTTSISMGFNPIGGSIRSEMGFLASIGHYDKSDGTTLSYIYDDYYFAVNNVLTGLGVESSASTEFRLPTPIEVTELTLGVGFTFGGTAWVEYTPETVIGKLRYGLAGDDWDNYKWADFTIGDETPPVLQLSLDQPGVWDFYVTPVTLQGVGRTVMDLEGQIYATFLWYDATIWESDTIHVPPSSKDFEIIESNWSELQKFSITVGNGEATVPEPHALFLLGLGMAGLAGLRRMQVAATALHGDFIPATRNEADFVTSGVKIHNPWKG